ncbi:allantoinase PuuE [Rhizobium cauense]|uniref:allantoinase PuuE n=1 Tax=Rhizobium cauense TaxID=1166683 RepID=UPI001C6E4CC9|nr:allantoinase PuuE [Rhizobium cauense]MBW9113805.1 allantoinase PuuE [Rhizobium cauense]
MRYPRDLHGYGAEPPDAAWPNDARIAVQFVVNYEEGGENCVLHGDAASEAFLSEIVGAQAWPGQRHWNMESIYEYGARAGFWRLHRLLTEREIPVTVYGVATALLRSPTQVAAMQAANWEIASHGLKWVEHKDMPPEEERAAIAEAIRLHEIVTGQRPRGWYTGRCSARTVDLITQEGGFAYISDSYADDLPYWRTHAGRAQLVIPYALDTNDMRFATAQGFSSGDQFFSYLKDSFDILYAEGLAGRPRMLSIGLHCRLAGRPGRAAALLRFIDYVKAHEKVWLARRIDIAEHWSRTHPFATEKDLPSRLSEQEFVARFGGVFEHSEWIARRAFSTALAPANDNAAGLHAALTAVFRGASDEERLKVLIAHPDLAGKLALAKRLTESSTSEQAAAGLDHLTDDERVRFMQLNSRYVATFGFPFIMAVKGRSKAEILTAFESRIANDRATEFETACRQVERIAYLRLAELLPH